jgi:hypothetical protein
MRAETLSSLHWVGAHQHSTLNIKQVIDTAGRDLPQKYTPIAAASACVFESERHH